MAESGKEIFKGAKLGKISNRQIIKYGKIGDNIGYELTKHNHQDIYALAFVEKKGTKYVYDYEKCIEGTIQEMLEYIKNCKEQRNLIKFEKSIDK